jgi:hypothetical protein
MVFSLEITLMVDPFKVIGHSQVGHPNQMVQAPINGMVQNGQGGGLMNPNVLSQLGPQQSMQNGQAEGMLRNPNLHPQIGHPNQMVQAPINGIVQGMQAGGMMNPSALSQLGGQQPIHGQGMQQGLGQMSPMLSPMQSPMSQPQIPSPQQPQMLANQHNTLNGHAMLGQQQQFGGQQRFNGQQLGGQQQFNVGGQQFGPVGGLSSQQLGGLGVQQPMFNQQSMMSQQFPQQTPPHLQRSMSMTQPITPQHVPSPMRSASLGSTTQMMPPSPDMFNWPYAYPTLYRPGSQGYPGMTQDLAYLREALLNGNRRDLHLRGLFNILGPRSAYEIAALRHDFRALTNDADLGVSLHTALYGAKKSERLYYSLMGLSLGPHLFDLWLIDNVLRLSMVLTRRKKPLMIS